MNARESALLTDLYELTMGHAYYELGMRDTAVFELFVRRLPPTRRYFVAAGLAQVVDYLRTLRFTAADQQYLASLNLFPPGFVDHLSNLRFTGSLHAVAEGTVVFANEPLLRVTAPIIEAQLVESRILNLMHLQTLIASKASRCITAARGKPLVDFGMRRAHGAEAALLAARAAYLAGFNATATVEAGREFGIPLSGTMAHSFIQTHDQEEQALRNFARARGLPTSVLIDTYDTATGARRVAGLARELKASQSRGQIRGVRIDSGGLADGARMVRGILDEGGCPEIEIILSGNLDEHQIEALLEEGVPADAFGVGTRLDTSEDTPTIDMVYKLEEYAGKGRRKRSPGKETWPGAKQVYRTTGAAGIIARDEIALAGEVRPGEPLLREVMRDGQCVAPLPSLEQSREHCRRQLAALPTGLAQLRGEHAPYPVSVSEGVRALAARVDSSH
jgi:nicotinate phosphoribosyltransferase